MNFLHNLFGRKQRMGTPTSNEPSKSAQQSAPGKQTLQVQDIRDTQDYMKDVEKTVESAERDVRELEESMSGFTEHSRSSLDMLKKEEALHKKVLARLLSNNDWAEALRLMEQRSDERRHFWLSPDVEEEDLKVVLRSRILTTLLEVGRLKEASIFLYERSNQANRRVADIRITLRARNRLRQGQVDMITGRNRDR